MLDTFDLENKNGYTLRKLHHVNVLLGKNGCGKSTLLKNVEQTISEDKSYGKTLYITPERGGFLQYLTHVEQDITSDSMYLLRSRRTNQLQSFKQQAVTNFRRLRTVILEEIEKIRSVRENFDFTFDSVIAKINSLLDYIEVRREGDSFKLYEKSSGKPVEPTQISSGESELISLAIECLLFDKECDKEKTNFLFLDSPDVHLHPDLQAQLGRFLREKLRKCRILIATHSTAFLGAFSEYDDIAVTFMRKDQRAFVFEVMSEVHHKILPVFGAHPLSNVFNDAPVLLVEGEDDERVWQQAVRTSRGRLKVYPCSVEGVSQLNSYERTVQGILTAVYDNPKAYSLRDCDSTSGPINDLLPVRRFRLSCRAAENLLLSDDVLASLHVSWDTLKNKITDWLTKNETHPHFCNMKEFKEKGFARKDSDLKEIRNDLMGIIGSSKAWEIVAGQSIGIFIKQERCGEDSLQSYLEPVPMGSLPRKWPVFSRLRN